MPYEELTLRQALRMRRGKSVLGSVRDLVVSQIDLRTAKNNLEKMQYTQARRNVLDNTADRDSIPQSENARHEQDLPDLMAKSDFQYRNNGLYAGLLTRAADNIVGQGSTIQVHSSDEDYNSAKEKAFQDFYQDSQFTTNGLSGPQSQRVALLDCFRGGNSLWYLSDSGWQMFEPSQLGTPYGYSVDLHKIASGIEMGTDGKPSRYWVGPFSTWGYIDLNRAYGLRADRCFLMGNREYASGFRSVPPLASMISRFVDLDKYLEAELFGARAAATFVGVVKSPDPNIKKAFTTAVQKGAETGAKFEDIQSRASMVPGSMVHLYGEEEFDLKSSNRPGPQFKEFVRLLQRVHGIKLGMPLEVAYLDFSETNFSAAQMILNQAAITWGQWQGHVVSPLVSRHYVEWDKVQTEVKPKKSVTRENKFSVQHHQPKWANYLKEAMGRREMMDAGAISLTDVARELGQEAEDVIRKRISEYKAVGLAAEKAGYAKGSDEYQLAVAYGIGNIEKFRSDLVKAGMLKEGE